MLGSKKPYIGITGVGDEQDAEALLRMHQETQKGSHTLMLGAQVSYRTVAGLTEGTSSLSRDSVKRVYRKVKDNANENPMFSLHYGTRPLEQIDEDIREAARPVVEKPLSDQVSYVMDAIYKDFVSAGQGFRLGLQVNVTWPDPKELRKIKLRYPRAEVTLQLSEFTGLAGRMQSYDAIDYVLIDSSRGRGVMFDSSDSVSVARSVAAFTPAGLVFAGGLSDQNVYGVVTRLRSLLGTDNFGVDAQDMLKTGSKLDIRKASEYLRKAEEAFS